MAHRRRHQELTHECSGTPVGMANRPSTRLRRNIFRPILKGGREICLDCNLPHHVLLTRFLFRNSKPGRTPACSPLLCHLGRKWLGGHLSPQHAPGPWDTTIQAKSSTPNGNPTTLTVGRSEQV